MLYVTDCGHPKPCRSSLLPRGTSRPSQNSYLGTVGGLGAAATLAQVSTLQHVLVLTSTKPWLQSHLPTDLDAICLKDLCGSDGSHQVSLMYFCLLTATAPGVRWCRRFTGIRRSLCVHLGQSPGQPVPLTGCKALGPAIHPASSPSIEWGQQFPPPAGMSCEGAPMCGASGPAPRT